jgi:hypothetical protein
MMWRRRLSFVLVCALALSAAACGKDSTTPTSPTQFTTEDFADTIAPLGTTTHTFTVKVAGQVTVLLTSVSPLATLAIGVAIGSWDGTTCTPLAVNINARAGTTAVLTGTANPGNFCLQVYDSGNLTDAVAYAVQVTHP